MTRFSTYLVPLVFSGFLLSGLPSTANAQSGDLNCDGSHDVMDVQLMINKALKKPLSPLMDSDGNGIHDACPDSLCGPGTVLEPESGLCGIDPVQLASVKEVAFAEGAASVEFSMDNSSAFDAGVASVEQTILNLSGIYLNWMDFTGANLSHWGFKRATLNHADLSDTQLVEADLSDAEMKHADLTGATLTGADFGGADLSGVTWSDAICPDGTEANANGGSCCGNLNGAIPWAGCN